MIDREHMPIEQLWYTWSEVGLGAVQAGFRVRAASEGLSDVQGERVRDMERYVHYMLPPGTDHSAITPEQAPRCLVIMQNEQNETIILHKQYTGHDGVGESGNFFTHLLALGGNSAAFSAADAIWLWGASLWQTSDEGLDQSVTTLNRLSLDELYAQQRFDPQFATVEAFLPFLIEAYLMRREACPIYIFAPTNMPSLLATLIAGLVRCLPRLLLAGLSFSTYEPDSSKATTQLVGLSANLGLEVNGAPVMPPNFYQQHLAINCATGEHSSLSCHPLTQSTKQAKRFARETTRCLLANDMDQLDALLDWMEEKQNLTMDEFLRFYSHSSGGASDITTQDIEEYISGPEVVQWLNNTQFREHVIKAATQDPRWCTDRLCPILSNHLTLYAQTYPRNADTQGGQAALCKELAGSQQPAVSKISANMPRQCSGTAKRTPATQNDALLLASLIQLANDVVAVVKPMLKEMSGQADHNEEGHNDKNVVLALLALMNACLLPSDIYGIWRALLEEIIADRTMLARLMRNPTPHFTLLQLWSNALPPTVESDTLIKPVLRVTWSTLGDFLLLHLEKQHDTWNLIALERLINSKSSLSATRAQHLAQIAAPEILAFLEQLIQVPVHWPLAIDMVGVLTESDYQGSQAYTDLLEKFFGEIIQAPQNWELARHLAVALCQSSRLGCKRYRIMITKFLRCLFNTFPLQSVGLEVVEALVNYDYAGKADLVPILLETTLYQHDLARVLPVIYPTDEELATFFVQQSKDYLATQQQVEAMLNLYNRLKPQPNYLERFWTLLDAPLKEVTVVQILKTIALDGEELIPTLQRYGVLYLQGYQECPQLAAWVIQTFTDLAARQYPIKNLLFTLFTQSADPSHLEILLARSNNHLTLADIREFLNTYATNPAYISFCCRSATLLALLEQYAKQLAVQPKKDAQQYSQEKMHMVALWLEPERVSEMALSYNEVEAILTSAHLQIPEQIQFLVHYGNHYLRYTQDLPHVQEYVKNYIASLTADSFDQSEQYALFKAVSLDTSLDTETRSRRLCWQHVLGFFAHPATDAQTLTNLGEALSCLPIDEAMGNKLAQAFVLCIQEESDLVALMHTIQTIPDSPYMQIMYCIAQQAAIRYNQCRKERSLIPYIVFVLTFDLVEPERFVPQFLDALLRPVANSDIDAWILLHCLVETYQVQPLSPQALDRWYLYLNKRDLLNKVQKAAQKFLELADSTDLHLIAASNVNEEGTQASGRGTLWRTLWQPKKPL